MLAHLSTLKKKNSGFCRCWWTEIPQLVRVQRIRKHKMFSPKWGIYIKHPFSEAKNYWEGGSWMIIRVRGSRRLQGNHVLQTQKDGCTSKLTVLEKAWTRTVQDQSHHREESRAQTSGWFLREGKPIFLKGVALQSLPSSSGWPHFKNIWAAQIGFDRFFFFKKIRGHKSLMEKEKGV